MSLFAPHFLQFVSKPRLIAKNIWINRESKYSHGIILNIALIALFLIVGKQFVPGIISPLVINTQDNLHSLSRGKGDHEVFGFAPYWNFDKLKNVDFNVLTTFAYFGVPVGSDGALNQDDVGYTAFESSKATELFKKAHSYGTRVVLTLTMMDNSDILTLMDDPQAQKNTINQAVALVKSRGIDGINVDFEYMGNPGNGYRNEFSGFIQNLSTAMHRQVPQSRVTVSVYASAVKDPKIYDIHAISQSSDGIFMMAYDFAVASSDNAIPTAPLYGAKSGKYWYDVSTAVNDFLAQMPASKLILGVPYYGYNYPVYSPTVKSATRPSWSWRGQSTAQTYAVVQENVKADRSGWDREGQVGWKAYYVAATGTWRMVFVEDPKSLGLKYDFAKQKNLQGVGVWALGMDEGHPELWSLLQSKFGAKLADATVERREIN